MTILSRLTGVDEVEFDLVFLGPNIQGLASELWAIVNLEQLGLAKLLSTSLQNAHDSLAAQTGVDLNIQAAPGEDVYDV